MIRDWNREQELIGFAIVAGLAFLAILKPALDYDLRKAYVNGAQNGYDAGSCQAMVSACRSLAEGSNLRTATLRALAAWGHGTGL